MSVSLPAQKTQLPALSVAHVISPRGQELLFFHLVTGLRKAILLMLPLLLAHLSLRDAEGSQILVFLASLLAASGKTIRFWQTEKGREWVGAVLYGSPFWEIIFFFFFLL